MARQKIDYGIDLGTTNSAIARIENGEPTIKKTDTQADTMPSCVSINKKKVIQVGLSAWNKLRSDREGAMRNWEKSAMNAYIEFKRTMGTDTAYPSSYMEKSYSSEELSAEILKKLKSFILDEEVKTAIVTVPAKFTINQKDATARAAKLAGFESFELLQEPIAASMAYGLGNKSKNGFWMVFDFGGGTFDAALVKVEEGIMQVIDTEGDNYLGGKNLDYAIVNEIIIPYLEENFAIAKILADDTKKQILQDVMKYYAEETKIQLSFNETHNILSDLGAIPGEDDEGNEFELDITVSRSDLERVLSPIFQKSVNISLELLKRNNLGGDKLDSLILVGGPTYSPILRNMLKQQVCEPDTSIDPMTAVAVGAALFASTIDVPEEILEASRDKSKIQLSLWHESTTVEPEVLVTVKTEPDKTDGDIPDQLYVELVRGDKAWSSGKVEINETGDVIEVHLKEGKPNAFSILLYDAQGSPYDCEPNTFTIIQGTKVGSAILPYSIAIEIRNRASGKVVLDPIKGLKKNNSLPAKGVANGLKTSMQLRPGVAEDFIKIPIYQGEEGAEGTRAIHSEHVYDIIITGEQLPSLLPEGSEVELTVNVDNSERISMLAYFPFLDFTEEVTVPESAVQKEVEADWLDTQIKKAKQELSMLEQESEHLNEREIEKIKASIADLEQRFEQGRTDGDRKKDVLDSLKREFRKIDDIKDKAEWPKTEEELKDVYFKLENTNNQYGNDETGKLIGHFKEQIEVVIKEKNVKIANQLIDDMRSLDFALVDAGLGVKLELGILHNFNEDFETHDWSDRNKARMLLNQGLQLAASNPRKEQLRPIIIELYRLLPRADKPFDSPDGKGILEK